MAIWKCSKCNIEVEEVADITLVFKDIDLPPGKGYRCPSCGVEYVESEFAEDDLVALEGMLEGK